MPRPRNAWTGEAYRWVPPSTFNEHVRAYLIYRANAPEHVKAFLAHEAGELPPASTSTRSTARLPRSLGGTEPELARAPEPEPEPEPEAEPEPITLLELLRTRGRGWWTVEDVAQATGWTLDETLAELESEPLYLLEQKGAWWRARP